MKDNLINKVQSLSLKWKILIPFLTLAFIGTISLDYIGLNSQKELIRRQESKEVLKNYKLFLSEIEHRKAHLLSLATVLAMDPDLQILLKNQDRPGLVKKLGPIYKSLKAQFGITIMHIHIPPGKSLLRLHSLEEHGEMIPYRKSIMEAQKSRKGIAALEWGISGLAIRGVAPVMFHEKLVGSLELGFPFGKKFLKGLKKRWGPEFTVYEKKAEGNYTCVASTKPCSMVFPFSSLETKIVRDGPAILVNPPQCPGMCVLLGPISDYFGEIVAIVKIDVDRSEIEQRLRRTKEVMLLVGLSGIMLSFFLTWLVASIFVRPIREIVSEAQEIAEGKRDTRLDPRPGDEVGQLTESLNKMLESLKERQRQIEDYARTLEQRVKERTADLVASEEKYRTLVDNLPLVVYRILKDGTTEFINPYFTEKLGYVPEEVVGNRYFWSRTICGHLPPEEVDILQACWKGAREFRVERRVKSKWGESFVFIDHAIPLRSNDGELKWIDGIMLDITELKNLQERALRAEEVRVLGEMSARFAHELRNPIVTAGGFARRLHNSLPHDDHRRKFTKIILEEVSRLEKILQIMLSSIEPLTLSMTDVDVGRLIRSWVADVEQWSKKVRFLVTISPDLPLIQGDEGLLGRAFENLLKNAAILCPENENIEIIVTHDKEHVLITIRHRAIGIGEEDIDQFFIPRLTAKEGIGVSELPLSKVIILRHGGNIDVSKDSEGKLVIVVQLPLKR